MEMAPTGVPSVDIASLRGEDEDEDEGDAAAAGDMGLLEFTGRYTFKWGSPPVAEEDKYIVYDPSAEVATARHRNRRSSTGSALSAKLPTSRSDVIRAAVRQVQNAKSRLD